ncbi:MAG: hypothetical protein IJ131_10045 [Eggerthellaceae bacterium]|nr:hypothetical protein [Eggerthellaceae bacterium]
MGVTTKNGTYLSDETLEEIAQAFERGEWPEGTTRILRGRPLILGEELQSVTYRDAKSKVAAMDKRAASLHMSRSDYLRDLVSKDLATAAS